MGGQESGRTVHTRIWRTGKPQPRARYWRKVRGEKAEQMNTAKLFWRSVLWYAVAGVVLGGLYRCASGRSEGCSKEWMKA